MLDINVMQNKASSSFLAGEVLINNNMLSPSIHCFYYGCVQIMIYILLEEFGKSEYEIEDESRNAGRGFHNWLINEIWKEYRCRNRERAREFREKIYILKEKRILADYKLYSINKNECLEVKNISKVVYNNLKEDFLL